jgi:hypothetical protein
VISIQPVSNEAPEFNTVRKPMQYILLCYHDEDDLQQIGDAAIREAIREAVQLTHELNADGHYLGSAPLHPISTATSVRVRNGKTLVTDGPFAETREVLGGYYLIDVPNVDDAIRIAERTPGARAGTVEIRPLLEFPQVSRGDFARERRETNRRNI